MTENVTKKSTGNLTQDALSHSRDLLLALSRAAQSVQRARVKEEVYQAVGNQIKSLGGDVSLLMAGDNPGQLVVVYTSYAQGFLQQAEKLLGLSAMGYRFNIPPDGIFARGIADGRTVYVKWVKEYTLAMLPRSLHFLALQVMKILNVKQGIFAPLCLDQERLGAMVVSGLSLTERDVPAMESFAAQIAISLHNLRLSQQMQNELSARRQVEESLSLQGAALEAAANAIAITDTSGIIQWVNQAWVELTGFTKDESIGRDTRILRSGQQDSQFYREMWQTILAGKVWRGEMKNRRKNGGLYDEEQTITPVKDGQGNVTHFIAIKLNITDRRRAEEKLRKSEEQYRSLFNRMMDGIYRSTHDGRFVDVNPAMVKMFGYSSREEMLAVDIKKELYFAPEERGSHILDTGQEEMDIYRMRRKDGSEIWVEDHGYYIHDEKGNILYHEGMLRDITIRKRMEEALRESEQNYRTLANSGQALIWTTGIDGRCNYFNETWLKFTGRTLEQELGEGWMESMHPDDFENNQKTYMNAFERREIFSLEYRLRRWDGEYRWLQDDGSPQYNTAGEFIGYIGHCLDITERKQAAEIIRESEERLTAVVEGSQLGYSDWNMKTAEIRRNERWAGMLGYTLKEIENTYQQWEDLLHPDDRESARQALEDHLHGRTPIHRDEYRLRAKDGSYRWILDQGQIVEYDPRGNPLRMTATHTDVTARRQAEAELRQAKEALEATHRELEEAFAREQQLARIDMLTGVNNRRYLLELAAHEFNVAARYGSSLSVLMFDVDGFKLVNDNFGHAIGDVALQRLTQVVCTQLRATDVIGRYGGDEFIVLLPQTGAGEAQAVGERIHASIASLHIETNKGLLSLTISLGIAEMPHNIVQPHSLEDLFQHADQALYAAKQAGRNRTIVFTAGE